MRISQPILSNDSLQVYNAVCRTPGENHRGDAPPCGLSLVLKNTHTRLAKWDIIESLVGQTEAKIAIGILIMNWHSQGTRRCSHFNFQ
jgi:hypothetical protein